MASEEHVLTLAAGTGNAEYIDLSSALTAVNRKQYHQTSRDGTPLCYRATVTFTESAADSNRIEVITATNNWTTRNAVKKMAAAWKKQLKDAGIRMKDLGTYARRLRIPLTAAMSTSGAGSMDKTQEPQQWNLTDNAFATAFQTYTTADGEAISYASAGEFTRIAIPDEAGGDSVEMNLALLGHSDVIGANNYFGVIDEYLGSRGGVIDEPGSSQQLPESDNLMQTLFSSTQPSTDEVIEALEDFQDYRPYNDGDLDSSASPVTKSNLAELGTFHGKLAPQNPFAATNSATDNSITVDAPLGLMMFKGAVNKGIYTIRVHSIYEM
jgi:hypothetical protein